MQNVELLHLFCKLTRELFLFVQKICQKGWCRANKAHAEPSYEKWKDFRLHFDIADELEYAPIQTRNGVHIWVDVSYRLIYGEPCSLWVKIAVSHNLNMVKYSKRFHYSVELAHYLFSLREHSFISIAKQRSIPNCCVSLYFNWTTKYNQQFG